MTPTLILSKSGFRLTRVRNLQLRSVGILLHEQVVVSWLSDFF